jgi:hypothetical protein
MLVFLLDQYQPCDDALPEIRRTIGKDRCMDSGGNGWTPSANVSDIVFMASACRQQQLSEAYVY